MFTALPVTAVYTANQAIKNVCVITYMKPDGRGQRMDFPSYKSALAWLKLQSAFDFQWVSLHNYKDEVLSTTYYEAIYRSEMIIATTKSN